MSIPILIKIGQVRINVVAYWFVFGNSTRKRRILEAIRFPKKEIAVAAFVKIHVYAQSQAFRNSIAGTEADAAILGKC